MLDDYSLIITGFLLALVVLPTVAAATRASLGRIPLKTAVVNGLVAVGLIVQYAHLVYLATYAPHHSSWNEDNNYVRYDCYEGEKGGKFPNDFRDCLLGQGDACTVEEPCTPCPPGGGVDALNTDFHLNISKYTEFLCRNCTDPYRSKHDCHFTEQYGPFCLVDTSVPPTWTTNGCPGTGTQERVPSAELQLPLYLLQDFGYVNATHEIGNLSLLRYAYEYPARSKESCWRCCTKMWDEAELVPNNATIKPPDDVEYTRFVSVELEGQGVYYTLDGSEPDPCLTNGYWYLEPIELTDIGTTVLRAISTFRGFKSASVFAEYKITDCSDEWFLEMSSQYPTGGLDNTKDALTDTFPQDTGAGTGDEYEDTTTSWRRDWIAIRFSAIVYLDVLTLSVYTRDRWDRNELIGADIEYFNTTLSDDEDVTFEMAVGDKRFTDEWFVVTTLDDTIPDTGFFNVSIPSTVGIKYLRIVSDSWLALGTLKPNVTGCYNSTIGNDTAVPSS